MTISPAMWAKLGWQDRAARIRALRDFWEAQDKLTDDNRPQAGRQPNERSEAGGSVHHDDPHPTADDQEHDHLADGRAD